MNALVAGLREKLGPAQDSLKLILSELLQTVPLLYETYQIRASTVHLPLCYAVTHGHADHTGALNTLMNLYPDVKIAYHKQEQAYLSGGGSCGDLQGDTTVFNLIKRVFKFNTTMVPQDRALVLTGESGDIAEVLSIPKGVLEFHTVPGHTPRQIVVLHKPTGSVIAADSLMHLPPRWPWSYSGQPVVLNPVGSLNMKPVGESQQKIAALSEAKNSSHLTIKAEVLQRSS